MKFDTLRDSAELMRKATAMLSDGPLSWYMDELLGAYDYMMTRYCPFKAGERVVLIKNQLDDDDVNSGLYCYRHLLVPGSYATVDHVACGKNGFDIYVVFDDKTYMDKDGNKHPVTKPNVFLFKESDLALLLPSKK